MAALTEIPLDQRGRCYLDELLPADNTLAGKVLSVNDAWVVSGIVPAATTSERTHQFDAGGLCKMTDSANWLTSFATDLHSSWNVEKLLVEDIWAKPEDNPDRAGNIPRLCIDEHVLYSADLRSGQSNTIADALRCPISFSIAVLAIKGRPKEFSTPSIVENTVALLLSAYDEESFLLCSSSSARKRRLN